MSALASTDGVHGVRAAVVRATAVPAEVIIGETVTTTTETVMAAAAMAAAMAALAVARKSDHCDGVSCDVALAVGHAPWPWRP